MIRHGGGTLVGIGLSGVWIAQLVQPAPIWLRVVQVVMLAVAACATGINLYYYLVDWRDR